MSYLLPTAKFVTGTIVATPGALQVLEEVGVNPATLLRRHIQGDWGDLEEHDREMNRIALTDGLRLFSAYEVSAIHVVWIITEADRSVTTFLLPSEY